MISSARSIWISFKSSACFFAFFSAFSNSFIPLVASFALPPALLNPSDMDAESASIDARSLSHDSTRLLSMSFILSAPAFTPSVSIDESMIMEPSSNPVTPPAIQAFYSACPVLPALPLRTVCPDHIIYGFRYKISSPIFPS